MIGILTAILGAIILIISSLAKFKRLQVTFSIIGVCLIAVGPIIHWNEKAILDQEIKDLNQETKILNEKVINQEVEASQPRKLLPTQKSQLIAGLSEKKGQPIVFVSRLMDGEGKVYADELALAFKEAGWDVGLTNSTFLGDLYGFLGIYIANDDLNEIASFVCQSFLDVSIECRLQSIVPVMAGVRSDTIYVVVGRKL